MEDGLTKKGKELVSVLSGKSPAEIIKPLKRDVYLFNTYVAGTSHLDDQSVLDEIHVNDELVLQREDNRFDEKAILVLTKDKKKLGYVPKKDNAVFSRLMDAGKFLSAKIAEIHKKGSFTQIEIAIYLIDF